MDERTRETMLHVVETMSKLEREQQIHMLGYAEGMRDLAKQLEQPPEPPEKKAG